MEETPTDRERDSNSGDGATAGHSPAGSDAAHTTFAFAAHPWVGLSVGVLGTASIQSSTTTTAITVTAVGAGALPNQGSSPREEE
jgi:solute carrier family 34 (sodium-dependent phosphate cotransporter)